MAKLSATTVYGKLKSIGETVVQGVLRVRNGIEVEGSESHDYAGIEAGPDAKNGHLMLDSRGGNLYLNWDDDGDVRINQGRLDSNLDANTNDITNVGTVSAGEQIGNATYATVGDVPTTLSEGAQVYVQDEDRIYVEDGT